MPRRHRYFSYIITSKNGNVMCCGTTNDFVRILY